MIKLKKISLENFKGIKSQTTFNFDGDDCSVNILSGPNGFGKTTIFDVVEFCLTGQFKRVERFDNVQKKTNNKNKPFFQNTDGEDVILKIWLYDNIADVNHIIIKHYDDDSSPTRIVYGRDFIPADSSNIFTTYLTDDTSYFSNNDFSDLSPVQNSDLNNLFYNQDTSISSTFYLFNYIQQEDSIYFLRQNEDDKGSSLGFLFNIEKEEAEKQEISNLKNSLLAQRRSVEEQRLLLTEAMPESQRPQYQKLFESFDFELDRETPFEEASTAKEKLSSFQDTIASLITLKNNFSTTEYDKYLRYKKLNDEILIDSAILKALLIKDVYVADLVGLTNTVNEKVRKANAFLSFNDIDFIAKDYFDLFIEDDEEYNKYLEIENGIKQVNLDLGEVGKIISEMNTYRLNLYDSFTKVKHTDHVDETNCPMCNNNFQTFEMLKSAIEAKTTSLESYNQTKIALKQTLEERIKEVNAKIKASISLFLETNTETDESSLALFRQYPVLVEKISDLIISYPILDSQEIKQFYFLKPPTQITEINEKEVLLKTYLQDNLLAQLAYNEQLIENRHLYVQYFESNAERFNSLSVEALTNKLQYLLGSYSLIANTRLAFLNGRLEKIDMLLEKVNRVHDKLHKTIQSHKAEMIDKIKVPFYIYSGKILQSYQQGLGIFIEIHSTNQSNNIRFKTGNTSDHDIVYHLSSGQMAVVSLAFCLALNKVYNTTQNFKFLAIDDPVQTMDDLNIHTFVELIRNEFKDFQMIFSTHDDFVSRYMKYKFDKFDMITDIQDVQKLVLEQQLT